MLRQFAGLAVLAALVSYGCETAPSTSQIRSFGAPLSLPAAAPAPAVLGFAPTGNVTMTISTTVDHDNNVTAATATFSGNLSGFPAVSSLTDAHVNSGVAGTSGPIVIDLALQSGQVTFGLNGSGSLNATVPVSPSVASQILANPAAFYFEVDTALLNGILRGQF